MSIKTALLLVATLAADAGAACAPVRIGYPDQHRPPYWLGNGQEVPAEHPGASVEMLRQLAASAGCEAQFLRLPALRLRAMLGLGELDFMPLDASAQEAPGLVYPRDRSNRIDPARAVPMIVVVFVRAADHLQRDTDPQQYFRNRQVGLIMGSPYAERVAKSGIEVDSGAADVARNFDKLRLGRVDGFAVSLARANDMDAHVAANYGKQFVRLEKPLFSDHIWLVASKAYYDTHRELVDTMWRWLGGPGNRVFARLVHQYTEQKP